MFPEVLANEIHDVFVAMEMDVDRTVEYLLNDEHQQMRQEPEESGCLESVGSVSVLHVCVCVCVCVCCMCVCVLHVCVCAACVCVCVCVCVCATACVPICMYFSELQSTKMADKGCGVVDQTVKDSILAK